METRIEDNFLRSTAIRGAKKWGGSWKGMYNSRNTPSGWGVIAYLCTEGNNADCICSGRTYMKLIAMIASGGSNCETGE